MAKYSFEFKLKMVQKYLDGEGGYSYLAKKYRVKGKSQIRSGSMHMKSLVRKGYLECVKTKNILFNLN